MQKTKHVAACLLFLMICAAGILTQRNVQGKAASAAIGFTAQKAEVTVDDIVSVYVTIDADATIGDFDGYVSYDSDYLEFKAGASCVAGGDGILKFSDLYAAASSETRRYLLKFQALMPGTCVIKMMNQPMVFEYETALPMSVSSTQLSIVINAKEEASDNALLESLKVNPGTLNPSFSKDTFTYEVTVPKETESLFVSAIAQDMKARVVVTGNSDLLTGVNNIHVFVTAETGKVQDYLIACYRLPQDEQTPTPSLTGTPTEEATMAPEPPEEKDVWQLTAVSGEEGIFLQGNYCYLVCEPTADLVVPAGFQQTKLMISGVSITAYAPASNEAGDFVLLILKKEDGTAGFYRYDRVEKTIQRYFPQDITLRREDGDDLNAVKDELEKKYDSDRNKMSIVIVGLIVICLILVIVLLRQRTIAKENSDDLED